MRPPGGLFLRHGHTHRRCVYVAPRYYHLLVQCLAAALPLFFAAQKAVVYPLHSTRYMSGITASLHAYLSAGQAIGFRASICARVVAAVKAPMKCRMDALSLRPCRRIVDDGKSSVIFYNGINARGVAPSSASRIFRLCSYSILSLPSKLLRYKYSRRNLVFRRSISQTVENILTADESSQQVAEARSGRKCMRICMRLCLCVMCFYKREVSPTPDVMADLRDYMAPLLRDGDSALF